MNKDSVFSSEYDISNTTNSQASIHEKGSLPKDKEVDEIRKKIESNYNLSKPRRKLIRARIIPK